MNLPNALLSVLILTGICLLFGCASNSPAVIFEKNTSQINRANCNSDYPKDLADAICKLDLETAKSYSKSVSESLMVDELRQLLYQENESGSFFVQRTTFPYDTLVQRYTTKIRRANNWVTNEFDSIAAEAKSQEYLNGDLATVMLANSFSKDGRKQELIFNASEFVMPVYRSSSGSPTVDVWINGKSFRFWLDTGAGVSVLSSAVAEEVSISGIGEENAELNTATKRTVGAKAAVIDSIALGELEIRNHPCVILDKKDLTFRFLGIKLMEIDGIIGWPLIKDLDLTIDLPNEKLTVRKPREYASASPILSWYWQPFLQLKTSTGCQLNLHIDTGAGSSSFYPDSYKKFSIEPSKKGTMIRGSAGGKETVRFDKLDSLQFEIGDEFVTLHNAEGIGPSSEEDDEMIKLDGVIGQDVLAKGVLRIDYSNRRYEFSVEKNP